ncbi:MAG: cupin domain-containing protein [Dokdonella sp.]|nr:cupin domain-containing protein [Dokdonella sp.]MCW5569084.1 cupin domain-containing protein [Dokdonella sp.]
MPPAIEVHARPGQPLGMPPSRFLRDYWQRHALLVRGAFAGMEPPLAPEDLAGLACEEAALSRIVVHDPHRDTWLLRSGPFDETDFATLPKTHWTLLVQDVDKWDADVAALLGHFEFIPSWRIDDIMVSYAVDGGSVGAHVDQYDVFLIQGMGRRRWQISTDAQAPGAFRDDVELKLLREFHATHDWLLEAGDLLYLPPGVPHHGIAEGACLTFSVGMRAPAIGELVADFAAGVAEALPETRRYGDAGMPPAKRAGEITSDVLEKLRMELSAALATDSSYLRRWFGSFITRYRVANEAVPRTPPLTASAFARRLAAGDGLVRNPWSRMAWSALPRGAELHVGGESHRCERVLAERLCRPQALDAADILALDDAARDLLLTLLNDGHLAVVRARRKR